jgi:hypothetical protein
VLPQAVRLYRKIGDIRRSLEDDEAARASLTQFRHAGHFA